MLALWYYTNYRNRWLRVIVRYGPYNSIRSVLPYFGTCAKYRLDGFIAPICFANNNKNIPSNLYYHFGIFAIVQSINPWYLKYDGYFYSLITIINIMININTMIYEISETVFQWFLGILSTNSSICMYVCILCYIANRNSICNFLILNFKCLHYYTHAVVWKVMNEAWWFDSSLSVASLTPEANRTAF